MINLIPPHARTQLLKEYWIRVASIWMLMLGVIAATVALLIAPSYLLVTLQSNALAQTASEARTETEDFEASAAIIADTNRRAEILMDSERKHQLSSLIESVEQHASRGIEITELRFQRGSEGLIQPFSVIGTAATRADLARFKDTVENDPLFGAVDLPISNLAKDIDIDFSITITLAANQQDL